ncbi:MAG: glycosyltransferase [Lachnospiraceae bacterium]|nr:glycosyltransferase [Lachnospiraceae bacterium]
MKKLSFVIPCYRSEQTIEKVTEEIGRVVGERPEYDYEIICVNDASPDGVWGVLKKLASANSRIKLVDFAQNMGKHAAVLAGFSYVTGDYVVNLDDDYQSPVNELWKLIDALEKDECDIATAKYTIKKESIFKKLGSNVNLLMSEIMLEKRKGLRFENFVAAKRFVCDEMIKYRNPYPYLEGLYLRVSKRVKEIPMEERDRADSNTSGFTFGKSFSLFVNGFLSFSVKPLRVATIIGFLFAAFGLAFGIFVIVRKIVNPAVKIGYSSIMAMLSLSNGLIMILLGMIGEYVGRIFICINNSPQYVVRETMNIEVSEK